MITFGCILQQLYAILFLIIWLGCSALAGYWLFIQPSDILSDINGPIIINSSISNKVIAGQTMTIDRSYCINNDKINGVVSRTFTNHVVYQLPDISSFSIGKGTGCKKKQYVIDIPAVLPSGDYEYRVDITYRLNPLKTVTFSLTPATLQVTNPVWDKIKDLTKEKK